MTFSLYAYRFEFRALEPVSFAPGSAANAFRGAFGQLLRDIACHPECPGARTCSWREECAYARLFEPSWIEGPSGFIDAPRPFVIRATSLDGRRFRRGEIFHVDVHVFDTAEPRREYLVLVFLQLASEGIGAGRGRVALEVVHTLTAARKPGVCVYRDGQGLAPETRVIELPLLAEDAAPLGGAILQFVTPTELKSGGEILKSAPFRVVFARARNRVATLAAIYTDFIAQEDIDFRSMAERAALVEVVSSDLHWVEVSRRSSRTGQVHPLGGFIGEVRYAGAIAEFLPILRAAYWTGVGRQTVWGKGVMEVIPIP